MSELFEKNDGGNGAESWRQHWDEVEAAADYEALPNGLYEAEPSKIEFFTAKSGTAGIKITWRIAAGEFQGRRVWQDCWLSSAALPFTKRVLAELRMSSPDDPLPDVVCAIQVARRTSDQGTEYNEVKRVKHLRTEENPFAPATPQAEALEAAQPAPVPPPHPEAGSQEAAPSAPEAPAAAPPASVKVDSPAAPQPVAVVLDGNQASMISAAVVQQVAGAIPDDGSPTDLDELCRLLPQHTSHSIMLALGVLGQHGLKSKHHRATWVYWWAAAPNLDFQDPVKSQKVLAADEQWFADMRAAQAAKQKGDSHDA